VAVILVLGGLVLLVGGAELLVRGAGRLAVALGISPLVVGLTVVAFGTSAPELAVGVQSAAAGRTELALGNVVGSNIFNTLAILGVAALVAPLVVHQKLVRREVPLVIAASALVLGLALDGRIGRVEGLLLLTGAIAYTVWAVFVERREPAEVVEEYAEGVPGAGAGGSRRAVDIGFVVVGLALLVGGADALVRGAVDIAETLGLSQLVIGLTIVAGGTSLPEAATSVVATIRGERDIAVGNVVGSNLFNLLAVLGLSSLVASDGVPAPDSTLVVDLPVLVGAAVLCLLVFFTRWTMSRREGALFVGLYVAYVVHLLLDAGDSPALGAFRWVVAAVVVAATAGLVVRAAGQLRARA
jgi:cation:H+ antiporter